jgi:hypothetical protein
MSVRTVPSDTDDQYPSSGLKEGLPAARSKSPADIFADDHIFFPHHRRIHAAHVSTSAVTFRSAKKIVSGSFVASFSVQLYKSSSDSLRK